MSGVLYRSSKISNECPSSCDVMHQTLQCRILHWFSRDSHIRVIWCPDTLNESLQHDLTLHYQQLSLAPGDDWVCGQAGLGAGLGRVADRQLVCGCDSFTAGADQCLEKPEPVLTAQETLMPMMPSVFSPTPRGQTQPDVIRPPKLHFSVRSSHTGNPIRIHYYYLNLTYILCFWISFHFYPASLDSNLNQNLVFYLNSKFRNWTGLLLPRAKIQMQYKCAKWMQFPVIIRGRKRIRSDQDSEPGAISAAEMSNGWFPWTWTVCLCGRLQNSLNSIAVVI